MGLRYGSVSPIRGRLSSRTQPHTTGDCRAVGVPTGTSLE